jgi:vacuolar-type H+-ATPase subunit E/Vma4
MAIEDILNALQDQAQADIEAVIGEAREHAALIGKQAEAEAAAIRENFSKQVERSARSKAAKTVNAARLEAKMTVSSAKGDGLEAVFSSAGEVLGNARSQEGYDRLFADLAAEALEGIEGDVVLHVDPQDEDRARATAQAAGVSASVETDITTAGGLVVEARQGRILRRNTLEDRLERARQFVQTDVAKALFA